LPLRTAAMAMAALPKACTPPILDTPYSILSEFILPSLALSPKSSFLLLCESPAPHRI